MVHGQEILKSPLLRVSIGKSCLQEPLLLAHVPCIVILTIHVHIVTVEIFLSSRIEAERNSSNVATGLTRLVLRLIRSLLLLHTLATIMIASFSAMRCLREWSLVETGDVVQLLAATSLAVILMMAGETTGEKYCRVVSRKDVKRVFGMANSTVAKRDVGRFP